MPIAFLVMRMRSNGLEYCCARDVIEPAGAERSEFATFRDGDDI